MVGGLASEDAPSRIFRVRTRTRGRALGGADAICSRVRFLNPTSWTSSRKLPAGRLVNTNAPFDSLSAVRGSASAFDVSRTVAPGTAPPRASTIRPSMRSPSPAPAATGASRANHSSGAKLPVHIRGSLPGEESFADSILAPDRREKIYSRNICSISLSEGASGLQVLVKPVLWDPPRAISGSARTSRGWHCAGRNAAAPAVAGPAGPCRSTTRRGGGSHRP